MSLAEQILQYLITGVSVGMVYALVGLGLTIIYNATGIINFAQGEFVMLGGMSAVALTAAGVPLWAAVILSVVLVVLLSLVVERAAIFPLRGRPVVTIIIATIGMSLMLQGGAKVIWGPDSVRLAAFSGEAPVRFGECGIEPQRLWVVALVILAVIAVQLFFNYTLVGKAMRATSANRAAARLQGISSDSMVRLSFALSAGLAALVGAAVTPVELMKYSQGTTYTLTGFLAAVVGGLGNGVGAVLGGLLLGVVESLSKGLISSGYAKAITLAVALAVLWLRPRGLLGRRGR
jgi:branched-chain amino acid transport system permease protein